MRKTIITTFIFSISSLYMFSQQVEKSNFEVKPYGNISYNMFLDTYKSVDTRDGELYYYPLKPNFDLNDEDINKRLMVEMLSITTRVGLQIAGPDFFSAKTAGLIETDFFGTSQTNILQLRLRHAMMNLKWEKAELLIGNYWHPVILTEMIPGSISFGGSAPYHALNRSNQFRFSFLPSSSIKITGAAVIHGYHRSKGEYNAQRYSGKPELILQAVLGEKNKIMGGFSIGYKWLTPRLITSNNYKTDKTIGSYLLHGFTATKIGSMSVKVESYLGQNLTYLNMIGGYGMVTGSNNAQGDFDYTNLKTLSVWTDVVQDIDKFSVGVFIGYQKLLGADDFYTTITDYNLNDDLNYTWRFSPRVMYKTDALTIAFEYMQTAARYGSEWTPKHKVTQNMEIVFNHRFLFSVTYKF